MPSESSSLGICAPSPPSTLSEAMKATASCSCKYRECTFDMPVQYIRGLALPPPAARILKI